MQNAQPVGTAVLPPELKLEEIQASAPERRNTPKLSRKARQELAEKEATADALAAAAEHNAARFPIGSWIGEKETMAHTVNTTDRQTLVLALTDRLAKIEQAKTDDETMQIVLSVGLSCQNYINDINYPGDGKPGGEALMVQTAAQASAEFIDVLKANQDELSKKAGEILALQVEIASLRSQPAAQFPIHLEKVDFDKLSAEAQAEWKNGKPGSTPEKFIGFINFMMKQDLQAAAGEGLRKQLKGVQDKSSAMHKELVEARRKVTNATELVARRNMESAALEVEIKSLKASGGFDTTGTSAALARSEKDLYKARLEIGQLAKELAEAKDVAAAYDALQKERVMSGAPDGEQLAKARQETKNIAEELMAAHAQIEYLKLIELERNTLASKVSLQEFQLGKLQSQLAESVKAAIPSFEQPVSEQQARWRKQVAVIEAMRDADMGEAADAALAKLLAQIKG